MHRISRGIACAMLALGLAWPLVTLAAEDDSRGGGTGGEPPAESQKENQESANQPGTEQGKTEESSNQESQSSKTDSSEEADIEAHRESFSKRTYDEHDTQPSEGDDDTP